VNQGEGRRFRGVSTSTEEETDMSTTDTLATRTTDLPTAVSDLKLEAVVIPVIRQMCRHCPDRRRSWL